MPEMKAEMKVARVLRYAAEKKVPLNRNTAHQFAAQQALVHYGSDTVYSFIPKNGCSTLRLSLAMANGCISDPQADWTWIHPNNNTFSANLRDLATARFTFTVLRCPHARLASVFLDKILSRGPEYWELFRAEGDTLDHDRLNFRSFVRLITKPGRLSSANIHWRPQVDFLVYEDYDAWYAMENFKEAAAEIGARVFPVVDARGLTRHGTDQVRLVDDKCYADVPAQRLAHMRRTGELPSHAALYDDALAKTVARAYATDMALYRDRCGAAGLTFPDSDETFKGPKT